MMSDGVIIALINTVGLVIIAVIGKAKLDRIGDSAEQAKDSAEQAQSQLRPNGGSTTRDAITRVETGMQDVQKAIEHLDSRTARIGDEVSQGRREALADRERIDALTQRVDDGLREHSTFRQQFDRLLRRA